VRDSIVNRIVIPVVCVAVIAAGIRPGTAAATTGALSVTATNSWSATVQWTAPPQVTALRLLRNGRLLDIVPFESGGTLVYTDSLLWPSTTYAYEVVAVNGDNQVVADDSATITTPAQDRAFPTLYAATSFWNQPIAANATADPNSSAMVSASIAPYTGSANLANSNEWGKPLAYANTVSELYGIGCTLCDCATSVSFTIPRYATPTLGADHHLTVVDPNRGSELDMFQANYNLATDTWTAGSRYVTDAGGWGAQCAWRQRCHGAVAAGFAAFGGVVRPEEIAQGHIDHALFFATPYTREIDIACPATNTDGWASDPNALPEGAQIQLDPSFNVDAQAWPSWEKVIARALQYYGAYLGDTGGSLSLAAEPNLDRGYDGWSLAGVPNGAPSLANLPWASFRVLPLQLC